MWQEISWLHLKNRMSHSPSPAAHACSLLLVSMLAGCATVYVPPAGAPTTQVTVARGSSPPNQQHLASFLVYTDDQCSKELGLLGWTIGTINPDPKVARLPTETPVFLRAVSSGVRLGSSNLHVCVNVVRLELEPGVQYELEQDFEPPTCKVRGRRTGPSSGEAQPMAITHLPVVAACKIKK